MDLTKEPDEQDIDDLVEAILMYKKASEELQAVYDTICRGGGGETDHRNTPEFQAAKEELLKRRNAFAASSDED